MAGVLEANFLAFETAIQDDVLLQKDIIKSMRGITLTRGLLDEIVSRIGLIQNTLKANTEKLERNEDLFKEQDAALRAGIERHRESISSAAADMAAEAKGWMRDFLARMKAEMEQMASTADVSDLQRYFQFYLMDQIKNAILACTQKHQKEMGDLLLSSAKSLSGELSQSAYGNIQTQIADCIADISWTSVDTAMFAGDVFLTMSGLSGALGPLVVVGQAVAGLIRQRTVAKKQRDIITPVLQAFPTVVSGIMENLDEIYAQLGRKALVKLDELYQNQIEVSREAMEHARQIAADENIKMQDLLNALDDTLQVVRGHREALEEYG